MSLRDSRTPEPRPRDRTTDRGVVGGGVLLLRTSLAAARPNRKLGRMGYAAYCVMPVDLFQASLGLGLCSWIRSARALPRSCRWSALSASA